MENRELEAWAKLKVQLVLMRCAIRASDGVEEVRYQRELDQEWLVSPIASRSHDRGAGRQA